MKTLIAFCGATMILTALWGMTEVLAAAPAPAAEAGASEVAPPRLPGSILDRGPLFPIGGRLADRGGFDPEPATRSAAKLHGTWDTRTGRRIQPVGPDLRSAAD